jgi:acyl carrier protein
VTERQAQAAAPLEQAEARLLAEIDRMLAESRQSGIQHATLDSALERDLGLDSLARVELMTRLEHAFGVSLPEQALVSSETPRDLLRFLRSAEPGQTQAMPHELRSLVQRGAAQAPLQTRTLGEALLWHVEHQPQRLTAFLYEEGLEHELSYAALYESALAWAAHFAETGLATGQRVAIMLPTCPEYLYCFYGVLLAGGVPVPLYPPARLSTIEDHLTRHIGILQSARASLMVTVPEAKALAYLLQAQVDSLRGVLTPADFRGAPPTGFAPVVAKAQDVAFLQYTSGSTGRPKGVVLTHENLLANVRAMGKAARATTDDVFVSWLPLYHDMGLIGGCFCTMMLGFPVVLMSPLAFLTRPAQWLWAIHRHRGTISGGPNFAYELCMRRIDEADLEGLDLSSWRFAFNGAEPVSPDTIRAFEARFAKYSLRPHTVAPVYGLAECSVGLAFTPPGEPWRVDRIERERFTRSGEARPAREDDASALVMVGCGRAIPEHDMRVVDAAGIELPERHEGQLEFRGPSATSGYYRNPEATRELFDGEWLRTGDRAYFADGNLFLTGREKDIIIRGGRNVSPYELEEAIGDLEGIRRGCVAAFASRAPDQSTERLIVLAETRETDTEKKEALRKRINELAVDIIGMPCDDVVLAPPHSVPKTSSGKIRRVASRDYYERGAGAVKPPPVWIQFLRLVWAGFVPQLRRGLRVLAGYGFALRAWLAFGSIIPLVFVAALIAPARFNWALGHRLARMSFFLAGIPLSARGVENLPPAGTLVLAVNHTSYLDPVALLALLEWRNWGFVAKREFQGNFFMRTLLSGFGCKFVERFDVRLSAEHASEMAALAKAGTCLIVFAEGKLTRFTGLHPFRTGAFQAAVEAGVPVVPVAIRGARSVLRDGTWFPRRAPVSATFSQPITANGEGWSAAVQLRDRVRAEVLRHCGEPDLAGASPAAGSGA